MPVETASIPAPTNWAPPAMAAAAGIGISQQEIGQVRRVQLQVANEKAYQAKPDPWGHENEDNKV